MSSLQSPFRPGTLKPLIQRAEFFFTPKPAAEHSRRELRTHTALPQFPHKSSWHSQKVASSVATTAASSCKRIPKDLNTVGSRFTTGLLSRKFGRKLSRRKMSII